MADQVKSSCCIHSDTVISQITTLICINGINLPSPSCPTVRPSYSTYLHVHYPAVDPSVPITLCDEVDVTQRGGLQIPDKGGRGGGA